MRLVDRGDWGSAADCLTRSVVNRKEALYKGHIDPARSAGCLALCLAESGKFEQSLEYLQLSLDSYEEQFGRYSHEFAVLIDKLTDRYLETLRKIIPLKKVYEKLDELLKEGAFVLTFYNEPGSDVLIRVQRKLAEIATELAK